MVTTLRSRSPAVLRYIMAAPSKGKNERDHPTTTHFTGELKDWQPFKQAVRRLADRYDYTWVKPEDLHPVISNKSYRRASPCLIQSSTRSICWKATRLTVVQR